MKKVVIVGGGFAGLNAAKELGNKKDVEVTLIDRRNHHLFQPLLYQVAMAGLSPADIAVPIRTLLSDFNNIKVLKGEVTAVNAEQNHIETQFGKIEYDYLILACGATHSYFGNQKWEDNAPGLKTLAQATEIRRRVLNSFEKAETESDKRIQKKLLTFVVVGGGPTGVELAGAIGEMSRYTLAKDFHNINPKLTRVILIEAGDRILASFDNDLSIRATRDLERLGCQVWTSSMVTDIDSDGVTVGEERIEAATVLWAAGVQASHLNEDLKSETDRQGRVKVNKDLSIVNHPNVFVLGDQAHFASEDQKPLPGIAPVAMQQGIFAGKQILNEIKGEARKDFSYLDKGQMATIGRSRAIVETGKLKFGGFLAWIAWLVVHIYYLTGFKNRFVVVFQWAWSYLTFNRGARLIVNREWKAVES